MGHTIDLTKLRPTEYRVEHGGYEIRVYEARLHPPLNTLYAEWHYEVRDLFAGSNKVVATNDASDGFHMPEHAASAALERIGVEQKDRADRWAEGEWRVWAAGERREREFSEHVSARITTYTKDDESWWYVHDAYQSLVWRGKVTGRDHLNCAKALLEEFARLVISAT